MIGHCGVVACQRRFVPSVGSGTAAPRPRSMPSRPPATSMRDKTIPPGRLTPPSVPPRRWGSTPVAEEDAWLDVRPLLDQELNSLPDRYREAVVLRDLEGKTRREAARLLGVPEGTLSGRLTTARRMLGRRLARRGVTLPAG